MPATRFYIPSGTTAPISPARDAEWNGGPAVLGRILTVRQNSVFTSIAGTSGTTTNTDVCLLQLISDPIPAQTISGTVKGILRAKENTASVDVRSQVVIRVVSNDGTTVRGTLFAADTGVLSNEWATALTNRKLPLNWSGAGATLASVVASANDRIVIELGFRHHTAVNATGSLEYGDASPTDLAENETGTLQDNGWVEFSADLFAGGSPTPRRAEVAWATVEVPEPPTVVVKIQRRCTAHYDVVNFAATDTEIANADMVIFQWPVVGKVARIKAINPNIKILFYDYFTRARTYDPWYTTLNQNEDWFVHNPATSLNVADRVRAPFGSSAYYLMDTANTAYRNFMLDTYMSYIDGYGMDGFFHDGPFFGCTIRGIGWTLAPTTAQLDAYKPNARVFNTAFRARLGSKLYIANTTFRLDRSATDPDSDDTDFLTDFYDGTMMEGAFHAKHDPDTGTPATGAQWDYAMAMYQRNLDQNKYFIPLSDAGPNQATPRWRDYCFAVYMLKADGNKALFMWKPAPTSDYTWYQLSLGSPTGVAVESPTDLWTRGLTASEVKANVSTTVTQGGLSPLTGLTTLVPSTSPRRGEVAWAEVEVPDVAAANRIAEVAWAEVEVPDLESRIAEVAWAEVEVPDVGRAVEVAWTEVEIPDVVPIVPSPNRICEVAWAELEVPSVGVTPSGDRRCEVAWAVVQVPLVGGENVPPREFGGGDFPFADPPTEVPFPESSTYPGNPQFPP